MTNSNNEKESNMSEISFEAVKEIQDAQKNIKIIIGSTIGIIFLFFFFTFAMLVDKAPPIFFTIETILVLILFPMLFVLNSISFAIIKFRKGKKAEFKHIFPKLNKNDVDEKTEKVLEKIRGDAQ